MAHFPDTRDAQTVGTWVGLDLEPHPGAQGRGYSEVVIDAAEDLVPSLGATGEVSRGEWGWCQGSVPRGLSGVTGLPIFWGRIGPRCFCAIFSKKINEHN